MHYISILGYTIRIFSSNFHGILEDELEKEENNMIQINKENHEIEFDVKCSKGTYIRSLCEDIAKKFNALGYMSELKRTEVDNFKIKESVTLDELEINKNNIEFIGNHLIKMENIFDNLQSITLNARKKELFLNGVMLTFELEDGLYNVYDFNNIYIGIGIVKDKLLKRDIII